MQTSVMLNRDAVFTCSVKQGTFENVGGSIASFWSKAGFQRAILQFFKKAERWVRLKQDILGRCGTNYN